MNGDRRTRDNGGWPAERRQRDLEGHFVDRRRRARPQRVLVVDDEADVRHVWREWLTMWRFHVEEAENGSIALLMAQQHPPDLVIMDVTMPVLDGFGATERLKSDPRTALIPVLLLSADVSKSAPERARRAGGDVFLSKPIRSQDLLAEIRGAFRRAMAAER